MTPAQPAVLEQLAAGGIHTGPDLAAAVGTCRKGCTRPPRRSSGMATPSSTAAPGRVAYQISEAGRAALYLERHRTPAPAGAQPERL